MVSVPITVEVLFVESFEDDVDDFGRVFPGVAPGPGKHIPRPAARSRVGSANLRINFSIKVLISAVPGKAGSKAERSAGQRSRLSPGCICESDLLETGDNSAVSTSLARSPGRRALGDPNDVLGAN